MNQFLEVHKLLKLKSKDKNKLNRPITSNKTEDIMKSPQREKLGTRGIHFCLLPNLQGRSTTALLKFFPENKRKEDCPTLSTQTLTSKPGKDTRNKMHTNLPHEHTCKHLS